MRTEIIQKVICDRCGRQMTEVKDVGSNGNGSGGENRPSDLQVVVNGEVVLQYDDLCDICVGKGEKMINHMVNHMQKIDLGKRGKRGKRGKKANGQSVSSEIGQPQQQATA